MVCHLLGSGLNYIVQLCLGLIGIGLIYLKYRREQPKRSFDVWIKDVSKQIGGLLWGHLINILLAMIIMYHGDQCVPYFINYIIDAIFGVGLCLGLLAITKRLGRAYHLPCLDCGRYSPPLSMDLTESLDQSILSTERPVPNSWQPFKLWLQQLSVWLLIITLVKFFLFLVLILPIQSWWMELGSTILHGLTENESVELLIVMIIIPLIVNICQFFIQDYYFKKKPDTLLVELDTMMNTPYLSSSYVYHQHGEI